MRSLTLFAALAFVFALAPTVRAEDGTPSEAPPAPSTTPDTDKPGTDKPSADKPGTEEAEAPVREPMPTKMNDVMLWMVEGTPRIYLFGTIHLPDSRLMTWPPVLAEAFAQSDALRTELKMDPAAQMKMQMEVLQIGMLPPGESLDAVVGEATWREMAKRLGMQAEMVKRMQPWLAYFVMIAGELQKKYAEEGAPHKASDALDAVIYKRAEARGLDVSGLETPLEQMKVFSSLTREEQVELIRDTLKGLGEDAAGGVDHLDKLLRLYLKGDAEGLMKSVEAEFGKDPTVGPKLVKGLLVDRNQRMVDRMLAFTKAHPEKTLFVAVGTAHMPGEHGIVKMLERRGHRVTRLHVGDLAKIKRAEVKPPAATAPGEVESGEAQPSKPAVPAPTVPSPTVPPQKVPEREPAGAGK